MEKNFFDQPIKNDIKTYDNIPKILTSQGDDYTTGCILDYNYFIKNYKMITTDSSKQEARDADSNTIQQINFTGNLSGNNNRLMFFVTEEAKETILDFSQGTALHKICENTGQ